MASNKNIEAELEQLRKHVIKLTEKVSYLEAQDRAKTFQIEQLKSNTYRLARNQNK